MDGWEFGSMLFKHSVVGLYTYFKYAKMGGRTRSAVPLRRVHMLPQKIPWEHIVSKVLYYTTFFAKMDEKDPL